MRPDSSRWTPAESRQAIKLWNKGFSGSEIAVKLRNKTRNGVLTHFDRLRRKHGQDAGLQKLSRELIQAKTKRAMIRWRISKYNLDEV